MHPFINLIHLKFFCDAVTYKSISEAAKMNYISQSAVSQAISKLEAIFGVQLLRNSRRTIILSDEGAIVFEQAHQIFKLIQETFDKVNRAKKEFSGSFSFVTTKSLGMSLIASSYQMIKTALPSIQFNFKMGGLNMIRTSLKRGEAEFAIVVYDNNFDQFAKRSIQTGAMRLYKSKDIPDSMLAEGIFVDELNGLYVKEIVDFFRQCRQEVSIKDAVSGWEMVARFADLGVGVGFFPEYLAADTRFPNLVEFPLALPPFEYEICAIYNKGNSLSRAAELFIEQFENNR